jgi:hypothetical protein
MSVWNAEHPQPSGDQIGEAYERKLLRQMTDDAQRQLTAFKPDPQRPDSLKEFERVIGGAWDTLLGRRLPERGAVRFASTKRQAHDTYTIEHGQIHYPAERELVAAVMLTPNNSTGATTIWLDERGKAALFDSSGQPSAPVKKLLEAGISVAGVDLLFQGSDTESKSEIKHPRNFAGFTYGYNYPLFAKRVHDVLSTIAAVRDQRPDGKITLVGFGPAGAWATAAAVQADKSVHGLAVDCGFEGGDFRFAGQSLESPHFLPGAAKYGDVETLLQLVRLDSLILYKPDPKLPRGPERDLMLATLIAEAAKAREKAK